MNIQSTIEHTQRTTEYMQRIIEQMKHQKIGVLGVGVEGRATIAYLLRHGISNIEALDKHVVGDLPPNIQSTFGKEYLTNLERFDVIFKSPGFRPDLPNLNTARRAGTKITSAISFFMEHCPAPVIGITGTVGKGTAASIVAACLEASGFTVFLGGNIGKSPLTFLDEVTPEHRVVLEISSFQAMDVSSSPAFAGILKTTTEHLDWHKDTAEYRWAKAQLLRHQRPTDTLVYNGDSSGAEEIAQTSNAKLFCFSLDTPQQNGVFLQGDQVILATGGQKMVLPLNVQNVKLAGRFNLENIMSAVLISHLAGGDTVSICNAAENFVGLSNRLELAAQSNTIRFFNDSYATRPDAAAAAIGAFDEPLALIMGGSEKNADFGELVTLLHRRSNIVSISLIGATAQRMFTEIKKAHSPAFLLDVQETLEDAMNQAAAQLPNGGVVLMAPACASFGMFKNYKDRGEQFVALAKKLASQRS